MVGGCHLSEDHWECQGEGQLLGPVRDDLPGPFPLSCARIETAHPQPPPPVPACVNFSNICFPWALFGRLGREGVSEAPRSGPCLLSTLASCPQLERPSLTCLWGSSPAEPPSEARGLGFPSSPLSSEIAQPPAPHPTWKRGLEAPWAWGFVSPGPLQGSRPPNGPLGRG